ncbi:hypothetical protein [Paracoccus sp. IB05]|uniref:hypothetical protein n=1 Tax=Paracoccus sp. IB05 TaxID=2779367 RepID=UPI0018E8E6F3|nr:hypothetical protein [Paracoccus sp. IB05]MBJ2151360.1 hypothetical protein [Paracoccus sp. IB05]
MNAMSPINVLNKSSGDFMGVYDNLESHLHMLAGLSSLLACLLAEGDNSMSNEREHCALASAVERYAADAQDLAAKVLAARGGRSVQPCPPPTG